MDALKIRSFVKDLTYDLDTVHYLLDYGRIKETVPIMERILAEIDSFRSSYAADGLDNIFSEDFWDKRLPDGMTFSQIRSLISKFSLSKTPSLEEELNKVEYIAFVRNVFNWSDEYISKLRYEAKSPLRKSVEKIMSYLIGIIIVLLLAIIIGWAYFTKDWGLRGDFYKDTYGKYLYTGYKKTIDFSDPEEMDTRLPPYNFSAVWHGDLLAPHNGQYTISEVSDDGVKIYVDGKLIITDWGAPHGADNLYSQKIFLTKGPHLITLQYYQLGGGATLRLYWAIDDGKMEIIPARYLRH